MTDLPYMSEIYTVKVEEGSVLSYDDSWLDIAGELLDRIQCRNGTVYLLREKNMNREDVRGDEAN